MTRSKKRKGNSPKLQKVKVWYLFGLHRLQVEADKDGFNNPLFGDATLISPEAVESMLTSRYSSNEVQPVMAAAGIYELTTAIDTSSVPYDNKIIEQSPDCFVAVQREVRPEPGTLAEVPWYRALEIISMIAIAYAADTSQITTFAGSELAKTQTPVRILSQPIFSGDGDFLTTQHTVQIATYPLDTEKYSKEEIRSALETGHLLKSHSGNYWSIHKKIPFIRIMTDPRRNSIEKLVVDAARHLYRSYHVQDPGHQLSGSVGVLEILLVEQSDFKKLEKRLLTLVPFDGDTPKKIQQLFSDRHRYVHQGEDILKGSAVGGLGIASIVLHVYAGVTQNFQNKFSLLNYLDFLDMAKSNSESWSAEQKQDFQTNFSFNTLNYLPLNFKQKFAANKQ